MQLCNKSNYCKIAPPSSPRDGLSAHVWCPSFAEESVWGRPPRPPCWLLLLLLLMVLLLLLLLLNALSSRSCKYCCSNSLLRSSNLQSFKWNIICIQMCICVSIFYHVWNCISLFIFAASKLLFKLIVQNLLSLSFLLSSFSSRDLIWIWNHSLSTWKNIYIS